MNVCVSNGRSVNVGDQVTLINADRWYVVDLEDGSVHHFKNGDVMTIVESNPDSDFYMNIQDDGSITLELEGIIGNNQDFE